MAAAYKPHIDFARKRTMQLRLVTVLALSLTSSVALAEEAIVADVRQYCRPRPWMTLPRGMFALSVAAQADLSAGAMADMISLAPDIAFGVTDDLTVALVHSVANATGFWSGHSNGSLYIMGDACGDVYSNGALLSKLGLRRGALAVAALGGVIYNIDPFLVGLGAGAEAQSRPARSRSTSSRRSTSVSTSAMA